MACEGAGAPFPASIHHLPLSLSLLNEVVNKEKHRSKPLVGILFHPITQF